MGTSCDDSLTNHWREGMNQMRNEQIMRVRDLVDLETPDNDDSEELGHAFFVAEAMPLRYKHKHPKTTTRESCREYATDQIDKLVRIDD